MAYGPRVYLNLGKYQRIRRRIQTQASIEVVPTATYRKVTLGEYRRSNLGTQWLRKVRNRVFYPGIPTASAYLT